MGNPTPTIFNEALADELIVINAIYGDNTAVATSSDADHTTVELRLADDEHTFHIRFPSSYPADCPVLTGSHPLHLSTKPIIANQICFFRACLIACHVPDEVSLYESIVRFDDIRQGYRKLTPIQAEILCQRDQPTVEALQEHLSALADAAQTALRSIKSPPEPPPRIILPHCSHAFCSGCLQSGAQNCLDTRSLFKCCGKMVPAKMVERYGNLDHMSMIKYTTYVNEKSGVNPIFCHERTCSAYIPSYLISEQGARCPVCDLLTCASCKKRVHQGLCARDTKMLKNIAKNKRWKFCPGCQQLVERSDGCKSMTCLCGVVFCYSCGKEAPAGVRHMDGNCCLKGELFDTRVRAH